jgi:acyl carrier protein
MKPILEDGIKDLLPEISKIAATVFEKPDLTLKISDSPLTINGWDSLNHVLFLAAIEDHFSIKFNSRDFGSIGTVSDLLNLIKNKIDNRQG